MRHHLWKAHLNASNVRSAEFKRLRRHVDKIIGHRETEEKTLSDYPEVEQYLREKFSSVDISDVKLYIVASAQMDRQGFKGMGGCYIDVLKTILVKNDLGEEKNVRGKFKKMMQSATEMVVEVEDVLVHEMIHAVSHKLGRSSSQYRHMEEEFVYTNCIDFYKNKGMSEDDIINNNFLPFVLNDVYQSSSDMSEIFSEVGETLSSVQEMDKREYNKFRNANAEALIPKLIERARQKARHMIDLYHKYGSDMYVDEAHTAVDRTASRFSALDFD